RRKELRDRVRPRRRAVLEPVPLGIERRREPVRAGEVDDDGIRRRLEGGGALVPETEEEDVRAARGRLRVRDERGQRAVQAHVERRRALPRERVRAEGGDLELRMREHAVERLLA